jgi:hypothetical protein
LGSELHAERGKTSQLQTTVAELSSRLAHAEGEAASAKARLAAVEERTGQLADDLRFVDETSSQGREVHEEARREAEAAAAARLERLEAAVAEEAGQARSEAGATVEGIAALQQRLVEGVAVADASAMRAEAAAREVGVVLRAELAAAAAAAAAARAQDVAELGEAQSVAQKKLADEMRWLDEEHMRCRAEDQAHTP